MQRLAQGLAYGSQERQTMDVYGREGLAGAAVAVILGCAESKGDDAGTILALNLAERGMIAVVADYPLNGSGRFPAQAADAARAVAVVGDMAGLWGGDALRLGVAGLSAGAWSAALLTLDRRYMAAVERPDMIRACACLGGLYEGAPSDEGLGPDLTFTRPIAYARAGAAPLWLGHGLEDRTASPEAMQRLAARMQGLGGACDLRLYEGLDHDRSLGDSRAQGDLADFLTRTLSPVDRIGNAI